MKTINNPNFSFEDENYNEDQISTTFGNKDNHLAEKLEQIKKENYSDIDLASLSKSFIEENKKNFSRVCPYL